MSAVAGSAAQESATYSTLGWDGLSAVLKDPQEDWLAAHELAHQWWGNLVTCRDWKDMWLHEGFGTYMQPLYLERLYGRKGKADGQKAYAAEIRKYRGPEPYKGKGIKYEGERILRKSGKSGKDK